jgi:hypothetical protein
MIVNNQRITELILAKRNIINEYEKNIINFKKYNEKLKEVELEMRKLQIQEINLEKQRIKEIEKQAKYKKENWKEELVKEIEEKFENIKHGENDMGIFKNKKEDKIKQNNKKINDKKINKRSDKKMADEITKPKKEKVVKEKKDSRADLIGRALEMKSIKSFDAVVEKVAEWLPNIDKKKTLAQAKTIVNMTIKQQGRWKNYTWDKENFLLVKKQ